MRDRRVAATYVLGHDCGVWIVPRYLARALSAYERAFLRLIVISLLDDVFVPDAPFVWLTRRIAFALARRPRDFEDAMLDAEIDLSGWVGNIWVVVVWTLSIGAASWLLRRGLPA
ncbi:MAG: hypothetical protein ABW128_06260 [Rhizorhabdus sp.]